MASENQALLVCIRAILTLVCLVWTVDASSALKTGTSLPMLPVCTVVMYP